ncbi:MAG: four helix bundle protein [Bacteroidota bacterium]
MKFDLEQRLIRFSITIIRIVERMPATKLGNYLGDQLMRSGIAPALLYGEAQSAESRRDFIHKMKIGLKELRETSISLTLIKEVGPPALIQDIDAARKEDVELISIFHKSISTATKNLAMEKSSR